MEIAKFMIRFKNKMPPISFNNCFTNLNEIHKSVAIPDKKPKLNFIMIHLIANLGENDLIMSA